MKTRLSIIALCSVGCLLRADIEQEINLILRELNDHAKMVQIHLQKLQQIGTKSRDLIEQRDAIAKGMPARTDKNEQIATLLRDAHKEMTDFKGLIAAQHVSEVPKATPVMMQSPGEPRDKPVVMHPGIPTAPDAPPLEETSPTTAGGSSVPEAPQSLSASGAKTGIKPIKPASATPRASTPKKQPTAPTPQARLLEDIRKKQQLKPVGARNLPPAKPQKQGGLQETMQKITDRRPALADDNDDTPADHWDTNGA
jgi:hypothetical protein